MFNVGPLELIVVLIIALIVLGPKRLPEVARSVGRGMREFRDALDREHGDEDEGDHAPEPDELHAAEPATPPGHAAERAAATAPAPAEPAAATAPTPPAAEPKPAAPAKHPTYQKEAESSEPSSSSSERV